MQVRTDLRQQCAHRFAAPCLLLWEALVQCQSPAGPAFHSVYLAVQLVWPEIDILELLVFAIIISDCEHFPDLFLEPRFRFVRWTSHCAGVYGGQTRPSGF